MNEELEQLSLMTQREKIAGHFRGLSAQTTIKLYSKMDQADPGLFDNSVSGYIQSLIHFRSFIYCDHCGYVKTTLPFIRTLEPFPHAQWSELMLRVHVSQIKVEDAQSLTVSSKVTRQLLENNQLISVVTLTHAVTLASLCTLVLTVLICVIPSLCLSPSSISVVASCWAGCLTWC